MKRVLLVLILLAGAIGALMYGAAEGLLGNPPPVGKIVGAARSAQAVREEETRRAGATPLESRPSRQILFGDLHVHTTYSTDANLMSLPMMQGDGPHPPADACDFARYCSRLDFWSINDHSEALTPELWASTRDSIRQCNALTSPDQPDLVSFLGYEWTQMAQLDAASHYGHKNVIFRDTGEGQVPLRPIAARNPGTSVDAFVPPLRQRLGLPLIDIANAQAYFDFNRSGLEMLAVEDCADDVNTRDLSPDCREWATTPADLFRKLDEGGLESIVIPHGNTWGLYSAKLTSWDKQLRGAMQDPKRQFLVEVYSGHGSSEEYRDWRPATTDDARMICPEPGSDYLPACWRAGEIIRERCKAEGSDDAECDTRAALTRQRAVEAGTGNEFGVVAGAESADWLDAGQCRDCFLPAQNYRPGGATQYALAIGNFDQPGEPRRFRFGLMASSDVHSARPGTGYKEYARIPMTEARGARSERILRAMRDFEGGKPAQPRNADEMTGNIRAVLLQVMERQASFWLTGGLVAVHADSRRREDIWEALKRKEVYGTSGPRILLWFDLLDRETSAVTAPMGSEVRLAGTPRFRVHAAGSFVQKPGCPADSVAALGEERLQNLCLGECYYPSDTRRPITRIEVVRIRPQQTPGEEVNGLIEDPWKVLDCMGQDDACTVEFEDEEFSIAARESLYYVRAIEAPSMAVNADPLRCEKDAEGICIRANPCEGDYRTPKSDDCLAPAEERAWSSPIFIDPDPGEQI